MNKINYVKGDATHPIGDGTKLIIHVCNDKNGWGSGFVVAISKRWKAPETAYRSMKSRELGGVQIVQVEPDIHVANMIAQTGYGKHGLAPHPTMDESKPPIRYEALEACLRVVADSALEMNASVHAPRIGCALAGGRWGLVEPLIEKTLTQKGIKVFIYDFPGGKFNL